MRRVRVPLYLVDEMGNLAREDRGNIEKIKNSIVRDILECGLTKKQKCYIMLYYEKGMSMPEIAEFYGVNKSTVSRTIKLARDKLYDRLKCLIK